MTVVPPSQGCREDPCGDAFRPLPSTLAGTPPPALGGWWAAAVSPLPLLPSSPRCVSERDRNWAGVSSPSPVNLRRPGLPLQTRAAPRGFPSVPHATVTPCHAAAPRQVPPGDSSAPNAGAPWGRRGTGVWASPRQPPRAARASVSSECPVAAPSAWRPLSRARSPPASPALGSLIGTVRLPSLCRIVQTAGASSPVCVSCPRRDVRTGRPPASRTAFLEGRGCGELLRWRSGTRSASVIIFINGHTCFSALGPRERRVGR